MNWSISIRRKGKRANIVESGEGVINALPFSLRDIQRSIRFCLNPVSYHGYGAIESVPAEIKGHRFKKGLICTDADLVKFKVIDNVTRLLDKEGLEYAVYDHIKPNPTIENVLEGVEGYEKMSQEEYREAAIKAVSKLSERTSESPLA